MNKPEQDTDVDDDVNQTKHDKWLQTIAETIENPDTAAEQLPEIWRQATNPNGTWPTQLLQERWNDAVETMFRNAGTYPQHAKLAVALSETPPGAWQATGWIKNQAGELLKQATTDQVLQALEYDQEHPENRRRQVSDHVQIWADIEQLVGPVIAQLQWDDGLAAWADTPDDESIGSARDRQRIVETIQQELLNGDNNAWAVFRGIVEPGHSIGETAALAVAIEQQNRPSRQET